MQCGQPYTMRMQYGHVYEPHKQHKRRVKRPQIYTVRTWKRSAEKSTRPWMLPLICWTPIAMLPLLWYLCTYFLLITYFYFFSIATDIHTKTRSPSSRKAGPPHSLTNKYCVMYTRIITVHFPSTWANLPPNNLCCEFLRRSRWFEMLVSKWIWRKCVTARCIWHSRNGTTAAEHGCPSFRPGMAFTVLTSLRFNPKTPSHILCANIYIYPIRRPFFICLTSHIRTNPPPPFPCALDLCVHIYIYIV